jgi:RNA 2',3'-cyclic 3'-phosphodiesterase
MPAIRTFISLPANLDVQQSMSVLQSKLKKAEADVKWDSSDKFHVTLKFLGNVELSKIELLSVALSKSLQQFPAFDIAYDSISAFPNSQNPRIVWIGVKSNPIIQDIQKNVEEICERFEFPKEDRNFHPHITLGRVKGNRYLARLTEAIKTITFEPIESQCSEVLLMKSDLHPSGSIYTILKSFPLTK